VADFLMPSLGADMERGKIVEWLVKPGDYVRRGDLVAVVDTDKTVMDVESFQEGVVAELLVDPGATVPIGTPLARITPTVYLDAAADADVDRLCGRSLQDQLAHQRRPRSSEQLVARHHRHAIFVAH